MTHATKSRTGTLDDIAPGSQVFSIIAMDQRNTLRRMFTAAGLDASDDDLRTAKADVARVLTPAASLIWRANGSVIDASGEHDLSPKTDNDWENITSGAATLAEATNALMIPGRALDPEWNAYVKKLADAADRAYQAAEAHDLKTVADVSDHLDGICAACHRHYGLE